MASYGEVSWESNGGGNKQKTDFKDLFLRLDDGDNRVRIITLPHQYQLHRIKGKETDKYGQKVGCSMAREGGICAACATGDKPKSRWLIGVLSRKDGKTKILDLSWTVFDAIRKYAKDQEFGDPSQYDMNIIVNRNGGASGYYSVIAYNKKPLTVEEQMLKDAFDLDDLKKRAVPPTPEQVETRLKKIRELAGEDVSVTTASAAATDDDDEFPDFASV